MIAIKVDVRGVSEVRRSLSRLQTDLRDRAMSAALNKVAEKANTEIKRAVTAEFNISASDVANAITLRKARGADLQATLSIFGSRRKRGRSLNVVHFLEKSITLGEAKRRSKKGQLYGVGRGGRLLPVLGFKFKKGGGVKQIEGAFLANKGRTVFVRTGDKRLPIKPVQMIGVSQMFSAERIRQRVMNRIDRDLVTEVDRAVKMVLARFG